MTSDPQTRRQPPWILLGVAVALLIGLAAIALVPHETCPRCHGFTIAHNEHTVRGLPDPASGASPCARCEGRGQVSRFSLWVHGDETNGD